MLILNNCIHSTLSHSFWTCRENSIICGNEWTWRSAWEIFKGDAVWTECGKEIINKIEFYSSTQPVYTLSTEQKNFFANDYLVRG